MDEKKYDIVPSTKKSSLVLDKLDSLIARGVTYDEFNDFRQMIHIRNYTAAYMILCMFDILIALRAGEKRYISKSLLQHAQIEIGRLGYEIVKKEKAPPSD